MCLDLSRPVFPKQSWAKLTVSLFVCLYVCLFVNFYFFELLTQLKTYNKVNIKNNDDFHKQKQASCETNVYMDEVIVASLYTKMSIL